MAKVLRANATYNGNPVTIFFDDAQGIEGGWGVTLNSRDLYRDLKDILRVVESVDDEQVIRDRMESELLSWVQSQVAAATDIGQVQEVFDQARSYYQGMTQSLQRLKQIGANRAAAGAGGGAPA